MAPMHAAAYPDITVGTSAVVNVSAGSVVSVEPVLAVAEPVFDVTSPTLLCVSGARKAASHVHSRPSNCTLFAGGPLIRTAGPARRRGVFVVRAAGEYLADGASRRHFLQVEPMSLGSFRFLPGDCLMNWLGDCLITLVYCSGAFRLASGRW